MNTNLNPLSYPDSKRSFCFYGGRYVGETLMSALTDS
jgi:tryptophan synthase beta subunit